MDPYGDQRNATTRYFYDDPNWPDFVTRIVPPMKDSTVIDYLPNRNREWQQDARGSTSRVWFTYWSGLDLLKSTDGPLTPPDSIFYDTFGNLKQTHSPKGFRTEYLKDSIGRDTLIVTPNDSLQTASKKQRHRITYDSMDRVFATETWARRGLGSIPADTLKDTLFVRNRYDYG